MASAHFLQGMRCINIPSFFLIQNQANDKKKLKREKIKQYMELADEIEAQGGKLELENLVTGKSRYFTQKNANKTQQITLYYYQQQKIEDLRNLKKFKMYNKNDHPSSCYKLSQVFGTNQSSDVLDQDIISCLKYDTTGQYLCLGDNAGRVIIFQAASLHKQQYIPYDYYAEFQSHVREFDPLKGIQCAEKIVDISWLRPQGRYLKLLTTNCKSIKFWKAFQKTDKKVVKSANKDLSMPKLQSQQPAFIARQAHIFPSVHSTQINSMSHSNNEEYILSTDQQQSFLWSLQKPKKPYIVNSISGRRQTATNQLSITCSKMHPQSDSIFVYGMNRCQLGVCDIRLSGAAGKVMDFGAETRSMKNFFTDMVATVGSAQFLNNGKYIVSREYLSVKVWDITNTRKPLLSICVQQSLKSKLVNLFESDNIFDKFSLATSNDNSTILTGNYNNCFHLLNFENGSNTQYELNFNKNTISRPIIPGRCPPISKIQAKKKTSALAYHPNKHSVAVAMLNCFFVYNL